MPFKVVQLNSILLLKGVNADAAILFPARARILPHRQRGDVSRRKRVVALYDELRPSIFGYLCSIGVHPEQAEAACWGMAIESPIWPRAKMV